LLAKLLLLLLLLLLSHALVTLPFLAAREAIDAD
jgi:hypothetical protein